jgi:antitoxin component of RelBE/YafQ-DinJ toxin-antitoxin module
MTTKGLGSYISSMMMTEHEEAGNRLKSEIAKRRAERLGLTTSQQINRLRAQRGDVSPDEQITATKFTGKFKRHRAKTLKREKGKLNAIASTKKIPTEIREHIKGYLGDKPTELGNEWMKHVMATRRRNQDLTFKEALVEASKTYKK